MKLKLQARYSIVIFSIIICIVTVLSAMLLFQFKTSMNNLSKTNLELMSKKLLEQINKRGEVMTSFLVENIKNPLYLYDMQRIYELLSTAAEQKDVLFIYVYDADGKIVHDGDEKIPMFGRLLDDEVSRRALRLKGGLTTQIKGDILRISSPILIGETLLGGITTGLSLKAIRSEIDGMNKRLNEMQENGLNRSLTTLMITTILFIVLGMFVSVVVSRRLIHPIKDLSNYASAVGKGDYEIKISHKREDEIGDLINSFNRMSRDLQHKEEALLKSHDELEQRVEERTAELQQQIEQRIKAEEGLKRAYEKLKDTQSQLIQSGKLASIGELASGVAHELNQPLMVIRGKAQLIQRKIRSHKTNANELSEQLEPINRNTKRMMNIINHLRTFSRPSGSTFQEVEINKVIEDSFLMVGEQLRIRNIEVEKKLEQNLPMVTGDVNQLEQVVLNMITNARDAIEDCRLNIENCKIEKKEYKGRIEIIARRGEFSNQPFDSGHGREPVERQPIISNRQAKDFIEILVRDNGGGISSESLEKVFDPFFTTKEVGKGTGLGLSISYGIIKDHQGRIEVAETGSEGTMFRIKLPKTNREESRKT